MLILLFFASCKKDESGYSTLRKYFASSLTTRKGAELLSACSEDHNILDENKKPIKSAYFAMIEGEFINVEDDIIQYGHVWSINDSIPYIDRRDTGLYYSKLDMTKLTVGTFVTRIPELDPETRFWVRSYVITKTNDTAYNKYVFHDTTLAPVDEWFVKPIFQGGPREGAVAFVMYNKTKKYNCGYIGTGTNGLQNNGDFWEFDPILESWTQKGNIKSRRDAVGFSLSYPDKDGNNQYIALIGTGLDENNNALDDFFRYDQVYNVWEETAPYQGTAVSRAVGFSLKVKYQNTNMDFGFVGTGQRINATTSDFYAYNPLTETWSQVSTLGDANKRKNATAFVVNNYAFVGLGENDSKIFNDIWMFIPGDNPATGGTWRMKNTLPIDASPRAEAVGFNIGNQGYIGTGTDGTNLLSDFWRYDPFNDNWYKCADYKTGPDWGSSHLPKPVKNAVGFGFSDRGFVGLGYTGVSNQRYSAELWIYRPW